MNSIEIVKEVRKRINDYNLSSYLMKAEGLEEGWQDGIPDIVLQIIVTQVMNIKYKEKD